MVCLGSLRQARAVLYLGKFVILRRYITSQVVITTTLVLGFLVVMLLGGRLIRYFGMAAEGGLDVGVLFTLIGYNLPFFLELILPLSFFIGLMLVLGRLYADHEMAVINSSGISRSQVARLLFPLVVFLFVLEAWISLVAKPWGVAKVANIWQEQSVAQVFDMIRPNEFISSGDYHLYVGHVGEDRKLLEDVIIVQMDSKNKQKAPIAELHQDTIKDQAITRPPGQLLTSQDTLIFAKSATQVENDSGLIQLDLHQGRRYEINPVSQKYSQVGFEKYRITLIGNTESEAKPMRIDGVPTIELLDLLSKDDQPNRQQEAWAELGYRTSLPWLMLIAVILATPLSYVKPRQGRWFKLVPAVLIFVANALVLISLKDSIAKGKLSALVYPLVLLALFGFALYLNYHERLLARMRLNKSQTKRAS